ncbi:MAG: hypothetical protein AB1665_01615 [Candidatus Thermoplasmatota archaeon]
MKGTWQKGCAITIVSALIATALVALSAPARANTEVPGTGGRFEVVFIDAQMYDEGIYNVDPGDGSFYLLGEGDGTADGIATANTLQVRIRCINSWTITSVRVNVTDFTSTVFDFNDLDTTEPDWPSPEGWWNPPGNNTFADFTWNFDVLKISGLGTATDTTVNMRIIYYEGGNKQSKSFDISIYLSSIFDNPSQDPDEQLPDVEDGNADPGYAETGNPFEPGDEFAASNLVLQNYDDTDITDLTCTLTEPGSGVTLSGGIDYCTLPLGINGGNTTETLTYRTDVAPRTAPGIYSGSADIVYTRDDSDLTVTENDLQVDWRVDFAFRDTNPYPVGKTYSKYQCYVSNVTLVEETNTTRQETYSSVEIEQPTTTDEVIKVNVTIVNNGNSDLFQVQYRLNIQAGVWDYFRNPRIYYNESSGPGTLNDPITLEIPEHPIGGVIYFEIEFIAVKEVPIGEHRLPIVYDGYYFNDGSLEEATGFMAINDGNATAGDGDDLSMYFSIIVTDSALDARVTNVAYGAGGLGNYNNDITETEIIASILNEEGYSFIDIMVTADFTGTPFYNPLVTERTTRSRLVEAEENPIAGWAPNGVPGDTITTTFVVDVDPNEVPDRYSFILSITAVIENTLETVTTTVIAELSTIAYGPRIYIDAFTTSTITPGQEFTLTLEITNDGDDTLRDAEVFIGADDTDPYPWDVICDFIGQIQREATNDSYSSEYYDPFSGWYSNYTNTYYYDWEGTIVTLEQLDIDSAKEIIELNLYMEGVYSSPSAKITLIRIGELAPGETTPVTFTMITDKDMVAGKPYVLDVWIYGIDSEGNDYEELREITVRSAETGLSYQASQWYEDEVWFDSGLKILGLFLFLIIVLALLAYVVKKLRGGKKKVEEPEAIEEEPAPEPEPIAAEQEVIKE